jgi:hypothetical protein
VLILHIAAGIVLAVIVLVCWQIVLILALVGAVLFGLAVLYVSSSPAVFSITLLCLIALVVWFCWSWNRSWQDYVRDDHGRS